VSWRTLGAQRFALGESPFWHPLEKCLYWVDISARQILCSDVQAGAVQAWDMPSEPGCIAPVHGGGLVIALRHGIFRARNWGGALEHLVTLDYDSASTRANDGKCDAWGRFWVATLDETRTQRSAALYCIDCRGEQGVQVQRKVAGALTGNALAWSPKNDTLYWADTSSHLVRAWDFDGPSGSLRGERIFLQFAPKPANWDFTQRDYRGRPDGSAVDSAGNDHLAMYEGRRVCKFAPDGTLLDDIATAAQCPTMPCFGGEDLRTMYLTSVGQGRSAQELQELPESGCVFSRTVQTPGLPVHFFEGGSASR
jgi:sugar lactone lactonase YvrE